MAQTLKPEWVGAEQGLNLGLAVCADYPQTAHWRRVRFRSYGARNQDDGVAFLEPLHMRRIVLADKFRPVGIVSKSKDEKHRSLRSILCGGLFLGACSGEEAFHPVISFVTRELE